MSTSEGFGSERGVEPHRLAACATSAGETITFSEEFEVPDWAVQVAGPWARKRSFLDERHSRQWAFVDLADPNRESPKMEWLIEGLLPLKYLAVLGGDSKSGKSWFVTAMALSIATGTPFMGLPTVKRPVMWLSFEENEVERQLAFDAWFSAGGAMPERFKFLTSYQRLYIDDPVGLQQIGETAFGNAMGLIVIDPLHAAYSSGTLSEGSTARRVLAGVKEFTREMDISVLVLHHLTKQSGAGLVRERMADSGQILAAASMDWLMEVREGGREAGLGVEGLELEVRGTGSEVAGQRSQVGAEGVDPSPGSLRSPTPSTSSGQASPARGEVGFREIRLVGRGRGAAVNRTWLIESPRPMVYRLVESGIGSSRSFLEARVLEVLRGGARSSKQVAAALGAPVGSVRNLLARLAATGAIQMQPKNKRENEYWVE